MNEDSTNCSQCRLFQGQIALLEVEIAGLRESVLALSRNASKGTAPLEIVGIDQPERLAIGPLSRDGEDTYCAVSISYRDQLSATCSVPIADADSLVRYFADLSQCKQGWDGEKVFQVGDGQLKLSCRYNRGPYRSDVAMDVFLALDNPLCDPSWTVHLRLDVDPRALEEIAARARTDFAISAAAPDQPKPPSDSH